MIYDLIIIGAGPAGLTSGIYSSRNKLKTLLIEKGKVGGLIATTDLLENYPGFPEGINGMELANRMKKQAEKFGIEIHEFEEVKEINQKGKKIKVKTNKKEYETFSVIISAGNIPKMLNVPGEKEFVGKGVSYCATCDGPLFKDEEVAIIGCGNSGLQEGEFLLKFVNKITFIEFLPEITAEKILLERVKKNKKTNFLLNHEVVSINGDKGVNSITVKDRKTNEEKEIKVSGVFVYVGFSPGSDFIKDTVKLDKLGYIITNEKMETSVPGIFSAGDIRSNQVRQIATACGNAVTAVINAENYIKELENKDD